MFQHKMHVNNTGTVSMFEVYLNQYALQLSFDLLKEYATLASSHTDCRTSVERVESYTIKKNYNENQGENDTNFSVNTSVK